jgi:RecA-family ATPase
MTDRFDVDPPSEDWQRDHPGWHDRAADDPAWRGQQARSGDRAADADQDIALRLIAPPDLQFLPVPERKWIVEEWLPSGTVTALYGDGGTGKTLLAQQLQTATATGRPWCGIEPTRVRSIGLYCEDDEDELHRRQWSINRAMGVDFADLGDMAWISGVGHDCTLVNFIDNRTVISPKWDWLLSKAKDFGARMLVLDTAADLFGGNENDRHQVRQFISVLSRGALEIGGAVLLNAHPSRTGLKSGDHDGGSTAWNNSVRSRWSVHRPIAEDGAEADSDARILTRRKANYARIGEEVRLRWQAGALVPLSGPGVLESASARVEAEATFMAVLARTYRQNVVVSSSRNATNYAPKMFAQRPERNGFGKREFERAMITLIADGRVVVEPYGRKGDIRHRLAVAAAKDAS